jgi:hypothetical protein
MNLSIVEQQDDGLFYRSLIHKRMQEQVLPILLLILLQIRKELN